MHVATRFVKRFRQGRARALLHLTSLTFVSLVMACTGSAIVEDAPIQASVTPTAEAIPKATATPLRPTPMPTPTYSPSPVLLPPHPATGLGDISEVSLEGKVFQLEVARTAEERSRGLMERTSLPENAGMIFVFKDEELRIFWMKDTLISLDILFLDNNGVVIDVQTMRPQPGATSATLTRYYSAAPARYAIEINAGLAAEYDIVVGSQGLFR